MQITILTNQPLLVLSKSYYLIYTGIKHQIPTFETLEPVNVLHFFLTNYVNDSQKLFQHCSEMFLKQKSPTVIHAINTFVLTAHHVITALAQIGSGIVFTIVLSCSGGRLGARRTSIAIGSTDGTGAGLAGPHLLLENPDENKQDNADTHQMGKIA